MNNQEGGGDDGRCHLQNIMWIDIDRYMYREESEEVIKASK